MKKTDHKDVQIRPEEVPEDDAIIGRVFRWSLFVFGGILVIVIAAVYLSRQSDGDGPEQAIETTSPETVATNTLDDGFDASPVVIGDELYLKGNKYLYCIAQS